jgi:hypothetical protein
VRSRGQEIAIGRYGKRARASQALVCVITAAVELLIFIPGCLNPRPEELPSRESTQPVAPEPAPVPDRESCGDNPLLGGCELPDEDINGDPIISPPAADPEPAETLDGTLDISGSPGAGDAGTPADGGL